MFQVWLQTVATEGEREMEGVTVVPRAARTKATIQTVAKSD